MAIKVSTQVDKTKYLKTTDPSGETYVVIRPPDFGMESERDEILKQRSMDRAGRVNVEVNLSTLWAIEIWLTYVETNLHVQYTDEQGEVVKEIKFEPKDQMTRDQFLRRLGELPPGMVYEWHMRLVEVVPDWAVPF